MEIKSQKDLLRKIWKNESLKNNCLNKVYKIEKGAEWDFKNEIFEGENTVKFFWSQIKTISLQCIISLAMTKQLLAQHNINLHNTPVIVYHMLGSVKCYRHIVSLNLHSEPTMQG